MSDALAKEWWQEELRQLTILAQERYPACDRWRTEDYSTDALRDRGLRPADMGDGWLILRLLEAIYVLQGNDPPEEGGG